MKCSNFDALVRKLKSEQGDNSSGGRFETIVYSVWCNIKLGDFDPKKERSNIQGYNKWYGDKPRGFANTFTLVFPTWRGLSKSIKTISDLNKFVLESDNWCEMKTIDSGMNPESDTKFFVNTDSSGKIDGYDEYIGYLFGSGRLEED